MEKIVNGFLYECKPVSDAWLVRTWENNGVKEVSVRQATQWVELCEIHPHVDGCGNPLEPQEPSEAEIAEQRLKTLQNSARRAKTMCRRVIIVEGFNELLTLTTRSNDRCRALMKRRFKEWVRRMKRALPGFRYCASFEQQKRGAMHSHVATHKLPKEVEFKGVKIKAWQLGTRIWRSIVGADNGLCFVGGRRKFGAGNHHKSMTPAKIAAYVSKYIIKDYEDAPEETNRYSRSDGCTIEKPVLEVITGVSYLDIIVLTFDLGHGETLVSHRLNRWGDGLWFCSEKIR